MPTPEFSPSTPASPALSDKTLDRNINSIISMLESPAQPADVEDNLPNTQPVDQRILKDVVAYVEVRSGHENRTRAIQLVLQQLGASIEQKLTSDVTHVIFREGKKSTCDRAKKRGLHLVNVLWVESCKQKQEHVSERPFRVMSPDKSNTPIQIGRLKKQKSMQPKDFDEEVASSGDRLRKQRKRMATINKWRLLDCSSTPNSPVRGKVLVEDTQPRSPEEHFTPSITIPDTPPSMREKLNQIRLVQEGSANKQTACRIKLFQEDSDSDTSGVSDSPFATPLLPEEDLNSPVKKKLFEFPDDSQAEISDPETTVIKSITREVKTDKTVQVKTTSTKRKLLSMSSVEPLEKLVTPTCKRQATSTCAEPIRKSPRKPGSGKRGEKTKCGAEGRPDTKRKRTSKPSPSETSITSRDTSDRMDSVSPELQIPKKTKHEEGHKPLGKSTSAGNITLQSTKKVDISPLTSAGKMQHQRRQTAIRGRGRRKSCAPRLAAVNSTIETPRTELPSMSLCVDDDTTLHSVVTADGSTSLVDSILYKRSVTGSVETTTRQDISDVTLQDTCPSVAEISFATPDITCEDSADVSSEKPRSFRGKPSLERVSKGLKNSSGKTEKAKMARKKSFGGSLVEDRKDILSCNTNNDIKEKRTSSGTGDGVVSYKRKSGRILRGQERETSAEKTLTPVISDDADDKEKDTDDPVGKQKKLSTGRVKRVKIDSTKTSPVEGSKVNRRSRRSLATTSVSKSAEATPVTPPITMKTRRKSVAVIQQTPAKSEVDDKTVNEFGSGPSERPTAQSELGRQRNAKVNASVESDKDSRITDTYKDKKKRKSMSAKFREVEGLIEKSDSNSRSESESDAYSVLGENNGEKQFTSIKTRDTSGRPDQPVTRRRSTIPKSSTVTSSPKTMKKTIAGSNSIQLSQEQKKKSPKKPKVPSGTGHKKSVAATSRKSSSSSSDEAGGSHGNRKHWRKMDVETVFSQAADKRCLVTTNLHRDEQDMVVSVIKKLGGFYIANNVNEKTTHVVCGSNRRTLNVLHCIMQGAWLLSLQWVLESLEAGKWLHEEHYERTDFFPAAQKTRLQCQKDPSGFPCQLFDDFGLIHVANNTAPPKDHMISLLCKGGAQLTKSLRNANLYIGPVVKSDVLTVTEKWVLDSITANQALPYDDYALNMPSATQQYRSPSPDF